jgi:hypothetical protein
MLRAPRQIDSQIKYFVAVTASNDSQRAGNCFTPAALVTALNTAIDAHTAFADGSIINVQVASTFVAAIAATSYAAGANFRDMGETLYIQQAGVNHYIYRLVQPITAAGINTEGVQLPNIYILTWSSIGTANVVRTGY